EGLLKADLLNKIKVHRKEEQAISLAFNNPNSTAVLTIKDWHNHIVRKYYKQHFKKEITEIFRQIQERNIKNLIIDVRDNQGGDTKNSKLLLSYLLDQPFELVEDYKVAKNGKVVDAKGPQMGWHKVRKERFKGRLFVLINGGSFSNTGIFCSVLKKYNRAIFIGEETGGSEFVICGSPKTVVLPNTKVQVDIPRLQFLIKAYKLNELSGVKPNHEIKPTIQDLINEKDVVKEFAIQLIEEDIQN
ncbi:MAG: S41 family peptidase, partial [Bacteroidota bacterium]